MNRLRVMAAAVVIGAVNVVMASVAVTNGGFELPAVAAGGYATSADGWSATGGGVAANADKFGGTAGGLLPAPGEGRQFAWINGSNSLYQQVGVLESNRMYTLTVALGTRSDISHLTSELALCAGAWNSNEVARVQGNGPAVGGSFMDVSFGFHTYGDRASFAGQALYARMTHTTAAGGQGVYDNVRVTESTKTAFISNADFEFPSVAADGFSYVPPGWSVYTENTAGGVVAMADKFGGVAGGPLPAPATGRQAAFVNGGYFLSQEIGIIESNKIYTLTVAVGSRSDFSAGTYTMWFKDGSWNSVTTLVTKTENMPTPGTFSDSSISFSTVKGVNADKVGHRLFVTFGCGSTAQCQFDNLRLEIADPPVTYVANPGFEEPQVGAGGFSSSVPPGWSGSGGEGVLAMASKFGGTDGNPLPAPAEGRQTAYFNSGAFLYQDVSSIESNRIYTLIVAHGRRSDVGAGTGYVWLRDNAWNGSDLAAATNATPAAGTCTNRTVSFGTTNNLHSDAVGHPLFVVLNSTGGQGAFDNVRLLVRCPARVSLSATAAYTNLATDAVLTVTGPRSSETDSLTSNLATGSVVLSQTVAVPTYVMLWLTGGDPAQYSALAAELSAGGATALTVADNDWIQLAKKYSGFNMLVKFPGQSNTAFNWEFGFGNAWDGTAVDKVAVSTKPVNGTLIVVF